MTRNTRWQNRRPRYRAVAHVPNFAILVPAPELSLSDAKNNPFRKMRDTLYRERQLWSGNESVEIWYVGGSSGAGTSASSPGVPRHMRRVSEPISAETESGSPTLGLHQTLVSDPLLLQLPAAIMRLCAASSTLKTVWKRTQSSAKAFLRSVFNSDLIPSL